MQTFLFFFNAAMMCFLIGLTFAEDSILYSANLVDDSFKTTLNST